MSLDQKFEAAAAGIKVLAKRPTDEELLELYALFKQASNGDVNIPKPGVADVKARGKWTAWDSKKGTPIEAAKEAYVAHAQKLIAKYK